MIFSDDVSSRYMLSKGACMDKLYLSLCIEEVRVIRTIRVPALYRRNRLNNYLAFLLGSANEVTTFRRLKRPRSTDWDWNPRLGGRGGTKNNFINL